jgi:hypothetical protein
VEYYLGSLSVVGHLHIARFTVCTHLWYQVSSLLFRTPREQASGHYIPAKRRCQLCGDRVYSGRTFARSPNKRQLSGFRVRFQKSVFKLNAEFSCTRIFILRHYLGRGRHDTKDCTGPFMANESSSIFGSRLIARCGC